MIHIPVIDEKEASRPRAHVVISIAPADRRRAARDKAAEIARNAPDVEVAKLNWLKAQCKHGTYRVDSGSIANAMVNEAVKNYRAAAERPLKSAWLACDVDSPSPCEI